MFGKFRNKIALAVLAGVSAIALGSTANAGSVDLVYVENGQVVYDSGWTASWSDAYDGLIGVSTDGTTKDGTGVIIQKSVNYTPVFYNDQGGFFDPAVITFKQRDGVSPGQSLDASFNGYATTININDEQLTNNTGSDWTSFRMFVFNGNATLDTNASAGFSVAPFTNSAFTPDNKELDAWGGSIANGATWYPGGAGALVINANPVDTGNASFTLKEQPISAIPLPAAVWSGLSGLVGLGLLASRKKLKKLA